MTATLQAKSIGQIDEELIQKAKEAAGRSSLQYKVIDVITVYKLLGYVKNDLTDKKRKTCEKVIDEITECLSHFVVHMNLPDRKLSVNMIFQGV